MSVRKEAIAVLISGRGSNLGALIDACADAAFPARIKLVIANKPEAAGLERAREAGIPARVIDHRDFSERAEFDNAIHEALEQDDIRYVCLAGFMRLFEPQFVDRWRGRMINIHPSLLPAFKGLDTHARAIEAGARFAGCSVHFVVPEMDSGAIIGQSVVPIAPDDTPSSLAKRVLHAEHALYPACLKLLCEGRLKIKGRRVLVEGGEAPDQQLTNPTI